MMTSTPDVLVVGAGPAGAAVALRCAASGHAVELVDRDRFPRAKVCGCCLADRGVAALRDLGLGNLVGEGTPLHAVEICTTGRRVELPFRGSVVLSRERLDHALVEAARDRGVIVHERTRATVRPDGTVETGHLDTGVETTQAPRIVVVADGLDGKALDGHPSFEWTVGGEGRFGAGLGLPAGRIPADAPPEGTLTMIAGRAGYLGVVRLPDGRLDLAAALDPVATRRAGGPGPLAARLLAEDGRVDLAEAVRSARWRGTARLTRRRRVVDGRIACVGDSSGYVEPFTGEGMSWALVGAGRLAAIIDRALSEGTSLDAWNAVHAASTRRERIRCRAVALAARHPVVIHGIVRTLARIPSIRRRLAGSASGMLSPSSTNLVPGTDP